ARRLRVAAADVHDGRRDGPGAGYVGGKAQIFDRIKAGVVLGDSLRVREPTGETHRHIEKCAGAERMVQAQSNRPRAADPWTLRARIERVPGAVHAMVVAVGVGEPGVEGSPVCEPLVD